MEVVAAIGSKLAEYLVEATLNQVRYMCCFNNIVERLEDKVNNLKLAKDRIQNEVEREEKNTKEIEKDVEKWLKDVDNAIADVQRLKEEIQAKKNCLNGWCPNWGWRYWLSRKASKKTSLLLKLQKSGKFSTVAHPKPLPGIEFSAPRDFMFFEATKRASDQVIEALKDEKTKMVGLYGSGGAGKTTLAKVVGDTLYQQKIFDEVAIAVVSQHPNIINVQNQLAESLGLKLELANKEERAKRLYLRFTDTKRKILVVLDDVWEKRDVKNELGIPVDVGHNNCKILLTTRRQQVCNLMGCNSRIPLGILKPEEGLALLKKHAGVDDDDSTLIDVAIEVAGECNGLPLAIVAVGSALIGKDVDEWKVMSRKLKKGELDHVDDINVDVYRCLKLSYDYLKCDDSKLCFLLCSLFPEDCKIDLEDLVRYGMGLGCYQGVESIEETRSLLRGTIKGLKASSLLLDMGEEGFVKMHDIVRDVALRIGLNEKKFFCKAGNGLTEWPEDEGMKQYTGISLVGNSIDVLPDGLECPNLHILLLGNKGYRIVVPDQFFEGMKALKVVTIIGGVLSLKSLEFLTNLQVLQLIDCRMRDDIAFLEKLKTMQILCLEGTSYSKDIPRDLGDKLNKLKLLQVGFSSWIKIHPVVLTKFSRLQEFYGVMCYSEVAGTRSENRFFELDPRLSFPKLRRYDIRNYKESAYKYISQYGILNRWSYKYRSQTNSLRMDRIEATSLVIFSTLYQNLQYLQLSYVSGCENIVPSIDQMSLNELTSLKLLRCEDLECIMDASQPEKGWNRVMLSRLATLELIDLPKLQWIWKVPALHVSLQYLTQVIVIKCHKLTHLFMLSQARSLKQLKSLSVEDCERLECIVEAKFDVNEREINVTGGDGKNIALPMLKELRLQNLPNLVSFCSGNYYSTWQALEELFLVSCPRLIIIDELHASVQYIEAPAQHVSLQYLAKVEVIKCHKLIHLFTLSQTRSLKKLTSLSVEDCERLECIVKAKSDENEREINIIGGDGQNIALPMLRELRLEELPNLVSFCTGNYYSTWQAMRELYLRHCPRLNVSAELQASVQYTENLQTLCVDKCPHVYGAISEQMKHGLKSLEVLIITEVGVQVVFLQQEAITGGDGQESKLFPSLKDLWLQRLSELEVLYKVTSHTFSLQNLTSLSVDECNRLRHLFSSTFFQNLLQLKELRIKNCSELEQVIDDSEDLDHLQPTSFPKLRELEVKKCPKLKRLFHISVAPSLEKLEQLTICYNDELVEVFWQKDGAKVVDVKEFVMSQLWWLDLHDLLKLTNFCPKGYQFTCPSLVSDIIKQIFYSNNSGAEAQQTTWKGDYSIQFPWEPYQGFQILSVKK